ALTIDNDTVVGWGGWTSGIGQPVTEWIYANDEGFTGKYRDSTAFDGLRLQSVQAGPTGSSASGLSTRARFAAERAQTVLSEALTARLPMSLRSTLLLGDRVYVDQDDAPDVWEGWARVTGRSVVHHEGVFTVELTPWE